MVKGVGTGYGGRVGWRHGNRGWARLHVGFFVVTGPASVLLRSLALRYRRSCCPVCRGLRKGYERDNIRLMTERTNLRRIRMVNEETDQ